MGYTLNLPEEDRYLKTREELMDLLVVLLPRPAYGSAAFRGARLALDRGLRGRAHFAREGEATI